MGTLAEARRTLFASQHGLLKIRIWGLAAFCHFATLFSCFTTISPPYQVIDMFQPPVGQTDAFRAENHPAVVFGDLAASL